MATTFVLSFLAFGLLCLWMIINRYRIEAIREELEARRMEDAINDRIAESNIRVDDLLAANTAPANTVRSDI